MPNKSRSCLIWCLVVTILIWLYAGLLRERLAQNDFAPLVYVAFAVANFFGVMAIISSYFPPRHKKPRGRP